MKITFVYPDIEPHRMDWPGYFHIGVASLSAHLKRAGHETSLIHITKPIGKDAFLRSVRAEKPDLIAFSSVSHMFPIVKSLAAGLLEARANIPTIFGGAHPTIAPEECICAPGIDMICRGEGENALLELCSRIESGKDRSDIPNLWVKQGKEVARNALGPLIENLDELAFPDRSIFAYRSLFMERDGIGVFMGSRGCPFGCAYCCNHLVRKIYGKMARPVRHRSVGRLIEEIRQAVSDYPFIESLVFEDDILFLKRRWAEEFAERYSREVGLPFICHARADITDKRTVALLKKAGCVHIKFAIESGNEAIRSGVLNRHMSNKKIKEASRLFKDAGLITHSYNMIGIPQETPESVLDTVKLNAEIGVDKTLASIYQPYEGTVLGEFCRNEGLIKKSLDQDFFSSSVLQLDTLTEAQVLMFRDYFRPLVRLYQLYLRFPERISRKLTAATDSLLRLESVAKIMNYLYHPLNYVHQRILARSHRERFSCN